MELFACARSFGWPRPGVASPLATSVFHSWVTARVCRGSVVRMKSFAAAPTAVTSSPAGPAGRTAIGESECEPNGTNMGAFPETLLWCGRERNKRTHHKIPPGIKIWTCGLIGHPRATGFDLSLCHWAVLRGAHQPKGSKGSIVFHPAAPPSAVGSPEGPGLGTARPACRHIPGAGGQGLSSGDPHPPRGLGRVQPPPVKKAAGRKKATD